MYGLYLYIVERLLPQKCIMENRLSCKIQDIKKKNVSAASFKTFYFFKVFSLFVGSSSSDFFL